MVIEGKSSVHFDEKHIQKKITDIEWHIKFHEKEIKNYKLELYFWKQIHKTSEVKTMPTIKQGAIDYVSPETKNITELESVDVNLDYETKKFNEGTPDEFEVNITKINDEEYRIPNSVLKQLQTHLEEKPDLKTFKVRSEGSGFKTKYTLIPIA